MRRSFALLCGAFLIFVAGGGEVRAQWGYGYYPYGYGGYGWGGWGGTVQGDIARGLGYFNMGAGIYNRETAIARSINTDTVMRWNQYVYESQMNANRLHHGKLALEKYNNINDVAKVQRRLRENPEPADIDRGDALNAALDQLSDPRIHTSALRAADTQIPARMIRDIPFRNAAEGVSFSLSQLKASTRWPAVLLDPRFASERADFETAVEEARKDSIDDGQVTPATLAKVRDVANRLQSKLAAMPLEDKAENREAQNFVKTVMALARMLEKPDIEKVLEELKKIDHTSIGNLLAFMHTFNLRFGPATTPRQRQAYSELFPILDQTRDKIIGEAKLDDNAQAKTGNGNVHDFFSAMDPEHISGKRKNPPPAPVRQP